MCVDPAHGAVPSPCVKFDDPAQSAVPSPCVVWQQGKNGWNEVQLFSLNSEIKVRFYRVLNKYSFGSGHITSAFLVSYVRFLFYLTLHNTNA